MLDTLRIARGNPDSARLVFTPERLRVVRTDAELSISDLASCVGVRDRTIERWERGDMHPSGEALARVERVLSALTAT